MCVFSSFYCFSHWITTSILPFPFSASHFLFWTIWWSSQSLFLCLTLVFLTISLIALLRCSEGLLCQCVVCHWGDSREHRGPLTEAKIKMGMRETPQCSLFLSAHRKPCTHIWVVTTEWHHTQEKPRVTTHPVYCHSICFSPSITLFHCHTDRSSVVPLQHHRAHLQPFTNTCSVCALS